MSSPVINTGSAWNIAVLWNKALESLPERPLVPRDYMWASELGQSFITRYLRMNAVKMSNPPNARSRRKFIAGHIWEWIIKVVLTMCGVLQSSQNRIHTDFKGMLRVSGKVDFIAGGQIDWFAARLKARELKELFDVAEGELPPFIFHAVECIINDLQEKFQKNPLKIVKLETKSISSFMAAKVEKTGAMPHHVLQAGHYIIGTGETPGNAVVDEAYIVYVCKDDCLMQQFDLGVSDVLIKEYKKDVKAMTAIYEKGFDPANPMRFAPPKDPEFTFVEGVWRFEKNFQVEYSPYLTMLYGYETPEKFRMNWQYKITAWNRVFKRVVKGENITPKNIAIIDQASKEFPDWVKMVKKAKAAGAFKDGDDQEEEE